MRDSRLFAIVLVQVDLLYPALLPESPWLTVWTPTTLRLLPEVNPESEGSSSQVRSSGATTTTGSFQRATSCDHGIGLTGSLHGRAQGNPGLRVQTASWQMQVTTVVLLSLRLDQYFQHPSVLDAERLSNGELLGLKRVKKSLHPYEAQIAQFFCSGSVAADSANHCVPIYDVLQVPDDDDVIILVMPLLREHYSPAFDTIGEAIEFFRQIFQVCWTGCVLPTNNDLEPRDFNSCTGIT